MFENIYLRAHSFACPLIRVPTECPLAFTTYSKPKSLARFISYKY
jgi:hypothetical protein